MPFGSLLYFAVLIVAVVITALVTYFITRFVYRTKIQEVTEEQIRAMVSENDELQDDEKRMIHEIIDLGDMKADEVMQPRVDMMLVEDVETVRQAADRMQGTGCSRLPVYHEDYDHIVGIVHYKDLMPLLLDGQGEDPVGNYTFDPMFVPETKDVLPLLSEMQKRHQQMAIVVDEYGGTGGLITVEDIVEEIVGEIVDETDREGSFLHEIRKDEWLADGRLPVEEALRLGWPVEESDDYETLAGWLLTQFDSIPQTGDSVQVKGCFFKIEGMRRRRIQRVHVRKICESTEDTVE